LKRLNFFPLSSGFAPKAECVRSSSKPKGIRSQLVALVAAALDPDTIKLVHTEGGMQSLSYLLEKPVPFREASDLFCLDFYRYFDIDSLSALAVGETSGNRRRGMVALDLQWPAFGELVAFAPRSSNRISTTT
jgi:hypothetical protein